MMELIASLSKVGRLGRLALVAGMIIATLTPVTALSQQVGAEANVGSLSSAVSPATGAAKGTWTFTFTAGGGGTLGSGSSINLGFPAGFTIPSTIATTAVSVNDDTDSAAVTVSGVSSDSTTRTVTIVLGSSQIDSNDVATVKIYPSSGLTNPSPSAATTYTLGTFSTSVDTGTVNWAVAIGAATVTTGLAVVIGNQDGAAGDTTAANAGASYSFTFTLSASGALGTAGGDQITLTFPSGFTVPAKSTAGPTPGVYTNNILFDGDGTPDCVTPDGTAAALANVTVSNQSITFTVAEGAANSAQVCVLVKAGAGVRNGPAATYTGGFSVFTTADAGTLTVAQSASGTVTAATSVTAVTVDALAPTTPSAASVYEINFTPSANSGEIAYGTLVVGTSSITVTFPSGTTVPSTIAPADVKVDTDATCSNGTAVTAANLVTVSGQAVTVVVPVAPAQAAASCIRFEQTAGIRNPAVGITTNTLTISTSEDTATVTSGTYTVTVPAGSVGAVAVTPVNNNASAMALYEIVTTATSGLLIADTIAVTFPSGTTVPSTWAVANVRVEAGAADGDCTDGTAATAVSSSGQVVTITNPTLFAAAAEFNLCFAKAAGLVNPTSGSKTLTVSTSEDTAAKTSAAYTIDAASSMTGVTNTLGSNGTGAITTYEIDGTTSAEGALTALVDTVTVTFNSSTTVPSTIAAANVKFDNDSDCTDGTAVAAANVSGQSVSFTVPTGEGVSASSVFSVCFTAAALIVNPSTAASYTVTVTDSADTATVTSSSYTVISRAVTGVFVTPEVTNGGVTSLYDISFVDSSGMAANDTITIAFPAGFTVSASPATVAAGSTAKVSDSGDGETCATGTNTAAATTVTYSSGAPTFTITNPDAVVAGATVCVRFARAVLITNPTTAGNYTVTVRTSIDTTTASSTFAIVAPTSPSFAADQGVTNAPTTANTAAVVDVIFTTSASGALTSANNDTVTITFPSNTTVPSAITAANVNFADTTGDAEACGAGQVVPANPTISGRAVTFRTPDDVQASGAICIRFATAAGLINPSAGSYTVTVSTFRDITAATSAIYTVAAGAATSIAFTTQPAGTAVTNQPFPTQPVVRVTDTNSNGLVNKSIQLVIKAGTGTTGAILTGCTANPFLTNSSGNATFAGCRIDTAGTGYMLTATDGSDVFTGNPVDSVAFDVLAPTPTPTSTAVAATATRTATSTLPPTSTTVPAVATATPVTMVGNASISASSNPVAGGTGNGTTVITWSTGTNPGGTGDVRLSVDGGAEVVFAQGTSGTGTASFIQAGHTYRFRLYQGVGGSSVLGAVTVTRSAGSPSVSASPNPATGGTTTVTWLTGNGGDGQVWVSLNGAPEVLFAQNIFGSQSATWIQSGSTYRFTLYSGTTHSTAMAAVDVT
ncbi:MAG: hypothetical protein EXR58_01930 [Chloroflexi bacterium]|nr:hypothetical protein [Chloroflexota bacterium]